MAKKSTITKPEDVFIEFLKCWQNKRWALMVKFTQKTWVSNHQQAAVLLASFYEHKELLSFEISATKITNNVMADIAAMITYKAAGVVRKAKISARLMKETKAYKPSVDGVWGVNPISTLKEVLKNE